MKTSFLTANKVKKFPGMPARVNYAENLPFAQQSFRQLGVRHCRQVCHVNLLERLEKG
jgi:hypothetical protein